MSLHLDSRLSQQLYTNIPVHNQRTIRLLRLHPGSWSKPISCDLHEVYLESAPPYKALSYAWVNDSSPSSEGMEQSILCNGVVIPISANLHAAVRRLRELLLPVELWVDKVCVNQKDLSERSAQVALMRDIYSRSTTVVIWLGECGEYDDVSEELWRPLTGPALPDGKPPLEVEGVLSRIDWFGDERDRDKWDSFLRKQQGRQRVFDLHIRDIFGAFCVLWLLSVGVKALEIVHLRHISQSTSIINGLHAIIQQAWWRRIWVVQETVVADKATMFYGGISAPWSMFARAAVAYDTGSLATSAESAYPYLKPLARFARAIFDIEETRRTWTDQSRLVTLLPLLRMFRPRLASDPRDKVFALLGLVQFWGGTVAETGLQATIDADYNIGADAVFWLTTTTLIRQLRSLDVLMGTLGRRTSTSALEEGHGSGRPSWVTDWNCPPDVHENMRVSNLRRYGAAKAATQGPVRLHGYSVLETHGFQFDEVTFVAPELPIGEDGAAAGSWRAIVAGWESCLEQLPAGAVTYAGGGQVMGAFWRTLCGDIEYVRGPRGRYQFRRVADAGRSSTYAQWCVGDPSRKRRTSIIAGYWQESSGVAEPGYEESNAFHHTVECVSGSRRFFLTRRGFMGTGPHDMLPGDRVFIISGCRTPFLLRRTRHGSICRKAALSTLFEPALQTAYLQAGPQIRSELRAAQAKLRAARAKACNEVHRECFSAVGDAYVHGIMDGQAQEYFTEEDKWRITGPIFLV